jgi:hypothetical protein
MSQDVQTFCLIAFGVAFLILVAGLLLIQVIRGSVFGLGMILMRVFTETKEEPPTVSAQNLPHAPTSDELRARAEALDFDAAVAKYRHNQPPANPASPVNNSPPASPPHGQDDPSQSWPR